MNYFSLGRWTNVKKNSETACWRGWEGWAPTRHWGDRKRRPRDPQPHAQESPHSRTVCLKRHETRVAAPLVGARLESSSPWVQS